MTIDAGVLIRLTVFLMLATAFFIYCLFSAALGENVCPFTVRGRSVFIGYSYRVIWIVRYSRFSSMRRAFFAALRIHFSAFFKLCIYVSSREIASGSRTG